MKSVSKFVVEPGVTLIGEDKIFVDFCFVFESARREGLQNQFRTRCSSNGEDQIFSLVFESSKTCKATNQF